MRRPFTVVATSLLSFGLASCSTSDDAAKQPAPSPVILTTSPTSGEAKQPTEPLAEHPRLILPHLKRHPNLHLPIAESRNLAALSPIKLTALHRRAPHTLLGLVKPTATTTPAPA